MKLIIVQCCATCQHQRGWLDNIHCERHQIQVHPYTICYDYVCDRQQAQRLEANIDAPNIVHAAVDAVVAARPHCPRCGGELNNVSPGISLVAGGIAICTSCLNPGETEVARARSI